MTAYRIVTDHEELDGVGQLTHAELDDYVLNTGWIIVSGSTGPIPAGSAPVIACTQAYRGRRTGKAGTSAAQTSGRCSTA